MDSTEHAGHTICGTPGCRSFHLFCSDCGARYHLSDSITAVADGTTVLVDIAPGASDPPATRPGPMRRAG